MAKLQLVGTVQNLFVNDNGDTHVTLSDVEQGGEMKVKVRGSVQGLTEGKTVRINCEVRGRRDKVGGVYLEYVSGQINPAKISVEG